MITYTINETDGTTSRGWAEAKRNARAITLTRPNPKRPGAGMQERKFSATTGKELGTSLQHPATITTARREG